MRVRVVVADPWREQEDAHGYDDEDVRVLGVFAAPLRDLDAHQQTLDLQRGRSLQRPRVQRELRGVANAIT